MNWNERRPRLVKRAFFKDNMLYELGCGVPKMTMVKAGGSSLACVAYQIMSCCLRCHILSQHGVDVGLRLIHVGGSRLFEQHIYTCMAQYWIRTLAEALM